MTRVTFSFGFALLVTIALFAFMQQLIHADPEALEKLDIAAMVELYRTPPRQEREEPVPEEEPPDEAPADEPTMDALEVPAAAPQPVSAQPMPEFSMTGPGIGVAEIGGTWTAPVAAGKPMEHLKAAGDAGEGYIEVVPYSTFQPNIPEIAWKNQINGWVLVVFGVTPDGHTTDVRVLDAYPRGIFDEEVIAAVRGWRYSVRGLTGHRGKVLMTQRIELFWEDYKSNVREFE